MVTVYRFLFVLLLVFGAVIPSFAGGGDNTVTIDGKQYSLHHVKAGETLYSIATSAGIDVAELKRINRLEGKGDAVKTDDIIIIPASAKTKAAPQAKDTKETVTVKTKEVTKETVKTVTKEAPKSTVTHTVKPGEGLYAIARQYGSSAAAIKAANNLTTDALKAGQILTIPAVDNKAVEKTPAPVVATKAVPASATKNVTPVPVVKTGTPISTPAPVAKPAEPKTAKANEPVNDNDIDAKLDLKMMNSLKSSYDAESKGKGTVEAIRGVAAMMQESGPENQTKFYALHKTAPVGKVLKVRNIMNNRITYVKVIGKLPDNSDNQNVMVKVSGAAGKYLKVLDAKFQCEVTEYK